MPLGLLPALGNLTSLTQGGALQASVPNTSGATSGTGAVNVGGLNVPALPSQSNTLLIGAAIIAAAFIWRKK